MDAPLTGRVGAVAEDVLLDVVVIQDGGGTHRQWGAKLERRDHMMSHELQ